MKFTIPFLFAALAAAAPAELQRRDAATCGSVYYSSSAVSAAASASCDYVQDHSTAGGSTYPHQYKNYEGFEFKGLSGPFYEFPILKSGSIYNGGSPGADRVIITQSCQQAGVITHQGASGNNFVACEGGNNNKGGSGGNNGKNGNSGSNGHNGNPSNVNNDPKDSLGLNLAAADAKVMRAALGMGAVFLVYIL